LRRRDPEGWSGKVIVIVVVVVVVVVVTDVIP
jgi:hypothetical protein